jgi:hypothetical protein
MSSSKVVAAADRGPSRAPSSYTKTAKRLGGEPILDREPWHAREFADVIGDENCALRQCVASDQHIIRPYGSSVLLKDGPNLTSHMRGLFGKRGNGHMAEELLQPLPVTDRTIA